MSVCCPESRFLRAAPRRVLRWRGARGALRPLFLLRSCAADQEKRPKKKSWAVMACASVRPERLGGHVHPQRSALYQSGAEGGRDLLAAWERFWGWILGVGFVEAVLCGGVLSVCCPEGRPRVPEPERALRAVAKFTPRSLRCPLRLARRSAARAGPPPFSERRMHQYNVSPAPAGAKTFLLGGFSFPSAFEMRKEKPRFRPPYGSFCELERYPARKNKSAWLLFRVLFFAGGDTPRKKSTRSAPRVPRQRSKPRGVKR